MTKTITIPPTHWIYTGRQKKVTTTAETLEHAILDLYTACPDMRDKIFDETGELSPGMEIALNEVIIHPWQPDRQLKNGDKIRISSIITGG